tara:strand:+ start:105 stop:341 length:237 start_codon:yes stop_codon:yes gene_type:complete
VRRKVVNMKKIILNIWIMIILQVYLEIYYVIGVILMIIQVILLELQIYIMRKILMDGDMGEHLKKKHIGNILKQKKKQ